MKRSERLERSGEKVRRRSLGRRTNKKRTRDEAQFGKKKGCAGRSGGISSIAIFRMFNTTQTKLFGFPLFCLRSFSLSRLLDKFHTGLVAVYSVSVNLAGGCVAYLSIPGW